MTNSGNQSIISSTSQDSVYLLKHTYSFVFSLSCVALFKYYQKKYFYRAILSTFVMFIQALCNEIQNYKSVFKKWKWF